MVYVFVACIIIAILAFYVMYALGKKSGRDEWIINGDKLENKEAKLDRQRFQKNMHITVDDAIKRMRSRSSSGA